MDNHKATISFKTLKSNLVNLPSNLTNLLFTANIQVQDVIIEIVTPPAPGHQLKSSKKSYAGWSGMSSSTLQSLEIDPIFAQALSISDKASIYINLKLGKLRSFKYKLRTFDEL